MFKPAFFYTLQAITVIAMLLSNCTLDGLTAGESKVLWSTETNCQEGGMFSAKDSLYIDKVTVLGIDTTIILRNGQEENLAVLTADTVPDKFLLATLGLSCSGLGFVEEGLREYARDTSVLAMARVLNYSFEDLEATAINSKNNWQYK